MGKSGDVVRPDFQIPGLDWFHPEMRGKQDAFPIIFRLVVSNILFSSLPGEMIQFD